MAWRPTAEYLADEGRNIFIGPMNGGLWNGRILDACIMSKKEGDNAAYEFLLKFGDQYASTLSAEQQHQWQNVKGKAAAVLSEASSPARNPNLHDYSCVSFVVLGLNKSIGTCGIRGI